MRDWNPRQPVHRDQFVRPDGGPRRDDDARVRNDVVVEPRADQSHRQHLAAGSNLLDARRAGAERTIGIAADHGTGTETGKDRAALDLGRFDTWAKPSVHRQLLSWDTTKSGRTTGRGPWYVRIDASLVARAVELGDRFRPRASSTC
jgi:hypothetical protein